MYARAVQVEFDCVGKKQVHSGATSDCFVSGSPTTEVVCRLKVVPDGSRLYLEPRRTRDFLFNAVNRQPTEKRSCHVCISR